MDIERQFYLGKKGTLYHQRENGSLSRFGIRIDGNQILLFDPLTRRWMELPETIPDRSGGTVSIQIKRDL